MMKKKLKKKWNVSKWQQGERASGKCDMRIIIVEYQDEHTMQLIAVTFSALSVP